MAKPHKLMEEISEQEKRIRALTKMYYSNKKVQQALFQFAAGREVVPRYFESFGKRPDSFQYISDIMGLVAKGATSFHGSEEIWSDALKLNADLSVEELAQLRTSWDLLIDIDSKYLDLSKIAARLIVNSLEEYGIKNYGLKFSGNKGFHIIVPGSNFPEEIGGEKMHVSFPAWPRAITEYLFHIIRKQYNLDAGKAMSFSSVEREKETFIECLGCNRQAKKGRSVRFFCPVCGFRVERKDNIVTKRKLRCLVNSCAGFLEIEEEKDYYYCDYCKDPENEKRQLNSSKHPESFEQMRGENAGKYGQLDLVLVASRHLFRMPYSLHEKTALASIVMNKEELVKFSPRDADPLKVSIREFLPKSIPEIGKKLLVDSLSWKRKQSEQEASFEKNINYGNKVYSETDFRGVTEEMFPVSIKNLLNGLSDGKKRGLFILLTFLRSLGYGSEYITKCVFEWNAKNSPPLKEGYIRSQLAWHFRQKKKILPPNYDNDSFYLDLGIIKEKPEVKNPIVEVARALRKSV